MYLFIRFDGLELIRDRYIDELILHRLIPVVVMESIHVLIR